MNALTDARTIPRGRLRSEARRLRAGGWRFVTATCLASGDGWTVIYHFERDERLRHLRVAVAAGEALPAIDTAYPAAFLVENEMRELSGIPVDGMSIDYDGRLYRDFDGAEERPRGPARSDGSPAAGGLRPGPAGGRRTSPHGGSA